MKKFKKIVAVVALCALVAQAVVSFAPKADEPVMVAKSDLEKIQVII